MVDFDFAKRLSQLRLKKGVSAREMSLAIGQNSNYINSIENGKSYPSLMGIYDICDYLNVSLPIFFDHNVDCPVELTQIIEDVNKLTPEQCAYIAPLIHDLVRKS